MHLHAVDIECRHVVIVERVGQRRLLRLLDHLDPDGSQLGVRSPGLFDVTQRLVFGIKPEGFDAASTQGEVDAAAFRSVCSQLMARFPRAKKVVITLRGSINADHNTWGGVLFDGETLYRSPRYDITDIVDRVGGGDSFMGGLIYGLLTYDDDQRALNFAAAASALKHTIYGDFNMVSVAEVENLMKGDGSGRVAR